MFLLNELYEEGEIISLFNNEKDENLENGFISKLYLVDENTFQFKKGDSVYIEDFNLQRLSCGHRKTFISFEQFSAWYKELFLHSNCIGQILKIEVKKIKTTNHKIISIHVKYPDDKIIIIRNLSYLTKI